MTAGEPMTNIVLQVNATDPADDELSLRSDGVLPQQIFQRQGSGALKPFSRLMYAILIDAVRCYQVNFDASRLSKKQQFSEAQAWLFHGEDNGPFSFRRVCDALEIDPDHVRRGPRHTRRQLSDWRRREVRAASSTEANMKRPGRYLNDGPTQLSHQGTI